MAHDLFYLLVLLAFLTLPALLALKWGDRLAEAWDRRRLRRRGARPRRASLPKALLSRDDLLAGLKAAEARGEGFDLRIRERLIDLQGLTLGAWKGRRSGSASDLLGPVATLENRAVRREETLGTLLDIACLQSDRIDAMTAEVDALSRALGSGPAPPAGSPPAGPDRPPEPSGATPADQLLRRIDEAARRRRAIDERLKQMKSWKPPGRGAPAGNPPPDAAEGRKGSRFDVTVR
jgi:hypothetical protein